MKKAETYNRRIGDLPDPNDEILAYLPSRVPEGGARPVFPKKAEALCRRLVSSPLSLWRGQEPPRRRAGQSYPCGLESHAEKLPLTFLDHRLIEGDSLTGPFYRTLSHPGSKTPLDDLFTNGLREKLVAALDVTLAKVHGLQATVGIDLAEVEAKTATKDELKEPWRHSRSSPPLGLAVQCCRLVCATMPGTLT